jgi:hypothetical protein
MWWLSWEFYSDLITGLNWAGIFNKSMCSFCVRYFAQFLLNCRLNLTLLESAGCNSWLDWNNFIMSILLAETYHHIRLRTSRRLFLVVIENWCPTVKFQQLCPNLVSKIWLLWVTWIPLENGILINFNTMLGFMVTRTMKKTSFIHLMSLKIYGSMQTYFWVNWMQATLTWYRYKCFDAKHIQIIFFPWAQN